MKDLIQMPGYVKWEDEKPYIYVNTIIIFFDYYFSYTESLKNKLRGGTLIRREQYELITDIITSNCQVNTETKFYQLIMGAGKSSYIAPLLTLLLITT